MRNEDGKYGMTKKSDLPFAWMPSCPEPVADHPEAKHHHTFKPSLTGAVFFLLVSFLAVNGLAGHTQRFTNVLIISIDALHPDALKLAKIPTLKRLMQAGEFTLNGHSTEPPKTLIAHTAMFTGLSPGENGKLDNHWVPGDVTIDRETLFDSARRHGFRTGFFYSKEKLGYLVSRSVDVHEWSRDNVVDSAEAFINTPGRHFIFLHVSGLDQVGPQSGWLSTDYLEELSFIDEYLSSLVDHVIGKQNYLVIVTSDHAGHGKIHGSDHAEDYRLPLIVCSDTVDVKRFRGMSFSVTELKPLLENLLEEAS